MHETFANSSPNLHTYCAPTVGLFAASASGGGGGSGGGGEQGVISRRNVVVSYWDEMDRLPPMTGAKRAASGSWDAFSSTAPFQFSDATHKQSLDDSAQFVTAAAAGARAQRELDQSRGTGVFETYELGISIVKSSKLYASQRRSNRQLPGGSDSTTAACYMLGGMPDSTLSPLMARISPCDPREERCKAVERVLKDKTRGAICALNGDNPREARADNLAAVRICEVVADILVAYAAKRLVGSLAELYKSNSEKDNTIRELQMQLEGSKRRRVDGGGECWCGGAGRENAGRLVGMFATGATQAGKEGTTTLPPPVPAASGGVLTGSSPLPIGSGAMGAVVGYAGNYSTGSVEGRGWHRRDKVGQDD